MNHKQRKKFAKKMAEFLFINGVGERADSLKGYDGDKYLGGWCESAVADQILKRLTAAERAARKKGKKK